MSLPARQMPWEWCTRIQLPRGRSWTYVVKVNGQQRLRARANNPVQLLRSIPLPADAWVQVRRV